MKVCGHCKKAQPESGFGRHPTTKDRLKSWCRACLREHEKERRARDTEHVRNMERAARQRKSERYREINKLACARRTKKLKAAWAAYADAIGKGMSPSEAMEVAVAVYPSVATSRRPKKKNCRSNCETCGNVFALISANIRFCSIACRGISQRKPPVKCAACKREFKPDRASRGKYCSQACVGSSQRRPDSKCAGCGLIFRAKRRDRSTYCSHECYAKRGRECRLANPCGQRLALDKTTPKRPVIKRHVREAVYARDAAVCQLCGGKVLMAESFPHPKSPSIDHVIPWARGGQDIEDNLQLAHLRCNVRRGHRGPTQLRILELLT